MNMLEADEAIEDAENSEKVLNSVGNTDEQSESLFLKDPCMDKHCGAGRVCRVNIQIQITNKFTAEKMSWKRKTFGNTRRK